MRRVAHVSGAMLTVYDTARIMAVSERTVQRLIASGDITAYRVGSRGTRVNMGDLSLYITNARIRKGRRK